MTFSFDAHFLTHEETEALAKQRKLLKLPQEQCRQDSTPGPALLTLSTPTPVLPIRVVNQE